MESVTTADVRAMATALPEVTEKQHFRVPERRKSAVILSIGAYVHTTRVPRVPPGASRKSETVSANMDGVEAERSKRKSVATPTMRADAAAIHARIIQVATDEFGTKGVETSLNQIAKKARIGPGTLYRHFPTRETLIDACMERWEVQLQAAVQRYVRSSEAPDQILVKWLDDFASHISVFRGGPARLLRALSTRDAPWMRRWAIIIKANQAVLDRLVDLGALDAVLADAEQMGILACSIAAAAEDAGLSRRRRRELLRVLSTGLLNCQASGYSRFPPN